MFEFVATASGRTDSWLANLLLDVKAALEALFWLVVDLLLACRTALIASSDAPRAQWIGHEIMIAADEDKVSVAEAA
jgi:hypothetical protein